MKKLKKSNVYKASNVMFDADKISAWSYDWWQFVKVIELNGKNLVIFNEYKYSPTTQRHQRKVRSLMEDLGIKIDVTVSIAGGLQSDQFINYLKYNIFNIYDRIGWVA